MTLKTGQYVRHLKYGWGTVLEQTHDETMVYFNSVGVKRFAASLAAFTAVQDKTPKKKPCDRQPRR